MPELLPGYTPGFGAARLDTLGGDAGSGEPAGPSGLDYSPDEGVFTWNGKKFSSVSALAAAINAALDSADLSDAEKEMEKEKLSRALGAYGFDVSFG